jgi:hypothetical protein
MSCSDDLPAIASPAIKHAVISYLWHTSFGVLAVLAWGDYIISSFAYRPQSCESLPLARLDLQHQVHAHASRPNRSRHQSIPDGVRCQLALALMGPVSVMYPLL